MKIIELKTENFKRIEAVEIRPEGQTQVVAGDNEQGKTSLLDSIFVALGDGRQAMPDDPIRHGADKARVTVDLGDYVVEKLIRAGKPARLTIKDKKTGKNVSSPGNLLRDMASGLSFDPLAFARADAPKKLQMLGRAAGLDGSDEEEVSKLKTRAKTARAEAKMRRGLIGDDVDLTVKKPASGKERLDAAKKKLTEAEDRQAKTDETGRQVEGLDVEIAELEERLGVLRESAQTMRGKWENQKAYMADHYDFDTLRQETEAAEREYEDLAGATAAYERAQVAKKNIAEAEAAEAEVKTVAEKVRVIMEKRRRSIQDISTHLSFDDNGRILVRDVPIDQISRSEMLKLSVALAVRLHPKLRVMLIRDGEALDKKSLKSLMTMAKTQDMQLWIERVGGDDEAATVVIEEGKIRPEATELRS